ncbi:MULTISPECIES: DUF3099 domain-containing protein [Arthrobacter]|uniref:DUF3099 domain-containing protein n=1 Tax=Arthrobacter caoxuetaonis TaxID=2886935 RepID=A0A9X1MFS3_9MICC|nr:MULTISPECIES: DUF3099 domain-containing protein [Arthrobacter]MCC3283432.1 DUF3099 domain-containing protein [Arthrobacter caoxuetaonis]MCC3298831.1 DUF3099 domain-containing protein [Arthrobacter caoxuetaonis]MCC9193465.1 DUF3099 domain-containing protein [Arthrobacter sp. zg-Y916]USQ55819.1 DUF3099 domain-containing protein [Arthrobacter caoxuetaonis]
MIKGLKKAGGGIPRITDARTAHTDEMHSRMVKYTVSMSIRMVCLFLLFFVHGWMMWVVIAGAVVLPWFAVVIANGGSDTRNMEAGDSPYTDAPAPALEARAPEAADSPETTVLSGEIIDDDGTDIDGTDGRSASA